MVEYFKVVIEELKQRISARSEKLRCYHARANQYRQNFSDATEKHCTKSYIEKKDLRKFHPVPKKQMVSGVNCGTVLSEIKMNV